MIEYLKRLAGLFSVLMVMAFATAACEQLATAQLYAGKGVARAILAECALSPGVRQGNLKSVNNELERRGAVPRASAIDCDGNGAPDF